MFKDVLRDETVQHEYGAWETKDFTPSHAEEGATKDMILITTKRKLIDNKITWWSDEDE